MSRPISKKTLLGGLAAVGVLGVGIAVPTLAYGHESVPAPGGSTSASANEPERWRQRHAEHEKAFAEALAKELGLPTEKVTAALEKVREQREPADRPDTGTDADRLARLKERLAEAVADGRLTQEQADAIVKAVEAGVLPGGGWWGHRGEHWRGR